MQSTSLRSNFFFLALFGVMALFVWMMKMLIMPLFLAAVLTALIFPAYQQMLKLLKGRAGLCSAISVVLALLLFVVPLLLVTLMVSQQALEFYQLVETNRAQIRAESAKHIQAILSLSPFRGIDLASIDIGKHVATVFGSLGTFVVQSIQKTSKGVFSLAFTLGVMLFSMFYLFRDGKLLLTKLQFLSPLRDDEEVELFNEFMSTVRGTLKGTVLIGLIQGSIGGLLFWILGLKSPLFWGTLMVILSIIPGVGAGLVWAPAAIYLIAANQLYAGLTMIAVGVLIISSIDNFMRPVLVGKDMSMHPLLIFLSTLGGIVIFGITGFILGPIVTALFLTLLRIYSIEYGDQLEAMSPGKRS